MRVLSDRERAEARAAYAANKSLSVEALAGRYMVSRSQMLRALGGITRPKGGVVRSKLTVAQMLTMYEHGLTLTEIARQAGLTKSGVSKALSRYKQSQGNRRKTA